MDTQPSPLANPVVVQIGFVVRDIERAIDSFQKIFDLPRPQITLTDPFEQAMTTYHGRPTEARAKLAFFHMGQVSLELIEPVDGPSTWQEHLYFVSFVSSCEWIFICPQKISVPKKNGLSW